MIIERFLKSRFWAFLSVSVMWILVALFLSFASFLMASQGEINYSLSITESILFEIICISPWIVCTPGIVWMARNFRFNKRPIWKSFSLHLATALILFSFHSFVQSSAVFFFFDEPFNWNYVQTDFIGFADMRILLYVGVLLGIYTIDFYKKNRDSILKKPRLKAKLNEANFHKILTHLQPDFLIKSIDSIKQDLERCPQEAEKHLTKLASLLRMMLNNIQQEEMMISEDMNFLDLYLDITEQRHGIHIERINKIDSRCYGAIIPNFLFIMPFLEELLQHGHCDVGQITRFTNRAWIEDDRIHLDGIISEVDLLDKELMQIKNQVNIMEIKKRLYDKFGDRLQVNTYLEDKQLHIHLNLPYENGKHDGIATDQESTIGGRWV